MKHRAETYLPPKAVSFFQAVKITGTVAVLLRKLGLSIVALALAISQIVFSVAQAQALSDDIDFDPPVIDHESLVDGVSGELQVFSAVVVDDRGLERVTLYYRGTTGQDYQQVSMQKLAATDNYTASVDSADGQMKIEYYIEALDSGGNRVLKGFPFFPLVRVLEAPPPVTVAEQPVTSPPPATSSNNARNNVLLIVLGVLAVGLIAGLSGGSGNDGGGGGGIEPADDTVPLTINVSPP